jgi:hypothetical protein
MFIPSVLACFLPYSTNNVLLVRLFSVAFCKNKPAEAENKFKCETVSKCHLRKIVCLKIPSSLIATSMQDYASAVKNSQPEAEFTKLQFH